MSATRLKRLTELHEERRRAPRDDVDFATTATRNWAEKFDVRLLNISPMGFHIRSKMKLERDQRLKIWLPGVGEIEGQLAWALTGCAGGWFIDPILPDMYPRVLAAIIQGAA